MKQTTSNPLPPRIGGSLVILALALFAFASYVASIGGNAEGYLRTKVFDLSIKTQGRAK